MAPPTGKFSFVPLNRLLCILVLFVCFFLTGVISRCRRVGERQCDFVISRLQQINVLITLNEPFTNIHSHPSCTRSYIKFIVICYMLSYIINSDNPLVKLVSISVRVTTAHVSKLK